MGLENMYMTETDCDTLASQRIFLSRRSDEKEGIFRGALLALVIIKSTPCETRMTGRRSKR